MVDGLKEIEELLEKLRQKTLEVFDGSTDAEFWVTSDGYASIHVSKWDQSDRKPADERKRRSLFDVYKFDKGWSRNLCDEKNALHKQHGVLLEEV